MKLNALEELLLEEYDELLAEIHEMVARHEREVKALSPREAIAGLELLGRLRALRDVLSIGERRVSAILNNPSEVQWVVVDDDAEAARRLREDT